jgi:hypothetical protein
MKLTGNVARVCETRCAYRVLNGVLERKRPLGYINVDGRIIRNMDFKGTGSESVGYVRVPQDRASCENGNESLGLLKGKGIIEQLSHYQFLKKDTARWN